eukprot:scaffold1803_cov92-Amphora_coffeaeformis.AAC.13
MTVGWGGCAKPVPLCEQCETKRRAQMSAWLLLPWARTKLGRETRRNTNNITHTKPPSTRISVPMVYEEASDARYRTAPVNSCGLPNRRMGMVSWTAANLSSSLVNLAFISVAKIPGDTLLTVKCDASSRPATSAASDLVNMSMAPFVKVYSEF